MCHFVPLKFVLWGYFCNLSLADKVSLVKSADGQIIGLHAAEVDLDWIWTKAATERFSLALTVLHSTVVAKQLSLPTLYHHGHNI